VEGAAVIALGIPVLLLLIWLMGKLSFIQKLVKVVVIVVVGYLLIILGAYTYDPSLAEQLAKPLEALAPLVEQLIDAFSQLIGKFMGGV